MQAFKEASLAFVGMDWVDKNSQDEQTNQAAQAVFAKISQAAKDVLAQAQNPASELQDEDLTVPQMVGDYVVPAQDAAQEYTEEGQTLDVVVNGGMTASHLALEDEQAVCWDMAEQLEDDLEGANDEISTQLRNAINLLKSAKTPTEIEHAKRIAKAAKAAAENNGSETGDDEPTLSDKLGMLNRMYEAAKKSNEAAQQYIEEMDAIRKENPGLLSKEGWDTYDAWKEKASKRQEEWEARRKAQEEEMKAAKTDEERQAIVDKYLKLEQEAAERAKEEDEEYRKQLDEEEKRIAKSGSEKDKQDMQKVQDEFQKYKIESKDRDEVSEKVKAALANVKTGLVIDQTLQSSAKPTISGTEPALIREARLLEAEANKLEFVVKGHEVTKNDAGGARKKNTANVARELFPDDDLLSGLGAPTEKEARAVAGIKTKVNATYSESVGEDALGGLAAPVSGKAIKETKAQTRIG